MRTLLFLFLTSLLALGQRAPTQLLVSQKIAAAGGYTFISSGKCDSNGGPCAIDNNTATYTGANTTGANLIAVCVGSFGTAPLAGDVTDNKGNTYTMYKELNGSTTNVRMAMYVTTGAITVGSGHNIIDSQASGFPGLAWAAFSGAAATPHDQSAAGGDAAAATSIQPGSLTPGQANELIVTCLALLPSGTSNTETIDPSFTVADQVTTIFGGTNVAGVLGYKIDSGTSAENPTWGWTGSADSLANMESFK